MCAKGVEASTGISCRSKIIERPCIPARQAAVLTGPNFAGEVAAGLPAAVGHRRRPIRRCGRQHDPPASPAPGFRLYGNDDPVGAQLGGAAKNVIAIAAGVV